MRRLLFLMVALSPVILMSQGCDGQTPTSPDPDVRTTPVSEVSAHFSTVAVADASGLIEACYDGGGNLYVIGEEGLKSECSGNTKHPHTLIAWNQQGPPGLPGPQGPKGDPGPAGAVTVLTVSQTVDLTPLWGGEKLLSCPTGYTSTSGGWLLVSPGIGSFDSPDWDYLYQAGSFKVSDSWKWKFLNSSTTLTFRILLEVYCLPKAT